MNLTQNWVGWLDRSAEQIKSSVLRRLPIHSPELTDHSDSNPLIILIDIFAGIAEMLNLYIDAMAREVFIGTARKYKSIVRIARQMDYRIKTRIPSSADITFTLRDSTGTPTPYGTGAIVILKGSIINSVPGGLPFVTQGEIFINPGYTIASVAALQYSEVEGENMGQGSGLPNQAIELPTDYAHNSLTLTIDNVKWAEYESFAFMNKKTKGFIVDVLEDGKAYALFGEGINGAMPGNGAVVIGSYRTTEGDSGNLPPASITQIGSTINLPLNYNLTANNSDYSSNGSEIEDIETIRRNVPKHLSTLRRAVSFRDYKDIAILAPGVGQAFPKYCCGDDIRVYITPSSRGIASSILQSSTRAFFENKRIWGRTIAILPAGITRLWLKLYIKANPGYTETQTLTEVITRLNSDYGFNSMEINSQIKPSDIVADLEELKSVDYTTIEEMYLEPYARPSKSITTPLLITYTHPRTDTTIDYRLIYHAGTNPVFEIYKNNLFYATVGFNTPYSDGSIISFTVQNSGLYKDGDEWTFRVFPSYPELGPVFTIDVNDITLPIIDVDLNTLTLQGVPTIFSDIKVEVASGSVSPNCKTC